MVALNKTWRDRAAEKKGRSRKKETRTPTPTPIPPAPKTNLAVVSLSSYQGYRFRDKDPIIAAVLNLLDQSGMTDTQVANKAFISPTTIRNWRFGQTRRPQHITIKFVLRVLGYDLSILPVKLRDKLIKSNELGTQEVTAS